jgi:uncharacterized repeat protein (TIGR01451 family)
MSRRTFIHPISLDRPTRPVRVRRSRSEGRQHSPMEVERLEQRITPSILGVFELDANVTTGVLGSSGSTVTSHDWDQVFANVSINAIVTSFVTDAANSRADNIFAGGGSKDTLGIQQGNWSFTSSKAQAKNDIAHAFAAIFTDPSNGHLNLYAGVDRFDNSGAATTGVWFLHDRITANPDAASKGNQPFTGVHRDGDVLLVTDFSSRGSTPSLRVFRWTGDDRTGGLVQIATPSATTFALVNDSAISVPWTYTNKSGQHAPEAGEFLEEGVDLTALGLDVCFGSFLANTRSSHATTATLSDFVIGSFPLCSVDAADFTALSKVGDTVVYPLIVQNNGNTPLFLQNVSDTFLGKIVVDGVMQQASSPGINPFVTSIASSFDPAFPLAPGQSATFYVTRPVQPTDPDPTVSTATFSLNKAADFSSEPVIETATNSVNLFRPSATLTVTSSDSTADHLGQVITYTYTVTNTSSADSPDLVLSTTNPSNSFVDSVFGDLEAEAIAAGGGSLAPGDSFTITETRAIQAGDPNLLTNLTTAAFTLAQDLGAFSNVITVQASASVTLVPHLEIVKSVSSGLDVIHPGDTASFTITVTNSGAGEATNVILTDQLPAGDLLTWTFISSTFGTTSITTDAFLTAISLNLAAGATTFVTVSAIIPLDIFGSPGAEGRLELPNTATVEADGIDPINSNGVLITVLGGDV